MFFCNLQRFGDFLHKKRHPGGWRNMQKFTKLPETNYHRWSPTMRRIIHVSSGETKNESNAQPSGSRCLFTAIRYAMWMRMRYTNNNAKRPQKTANKITHRQHDVSLLLSYQSPVDFVLHIMIEYYFLFLFFSAFILFSSLLYSLEIQTVWSKDKGPHSSRCPFLF